MTAAIKKCMNSKIGEFIAISVMCMVLWPLLDMAYASMFAHGMFHYTVLRHIVTPILFGAIFTLIDMLFPTGKYAN